MESRFDSHNRTVVLALRRLKLGCRLYLAARHPRVPWYAKVIAAAAVGYALSPIDVIPDFVLSGYVDDLILVPIGIALAIRLVPRDIFKELRARAERELTWRAGICRLGVHHFRLAALPGCDCCVCPGAGVHGPVGGRRVIRHYSARCRRAPMNILLIEDDGETANHIAVALERAGHGVVRSGDGPDALALAKTRSFDLFIVDRMLPGLDGLTLVKMLRADGINTPVLFLSTLAGIDDRVCGLDAGGDDYLVKPFAMSELLARVNALSRRPVNSQAPTVLRIADLELDLIARAATRSGRPIDLHTREFEILEFLMRNAGTVVTKSMLLERVWNFHFDPKTTVVETHISRLRGKIDKGYACELIQTVRGVGYCLRAPS